MLVKSGRWRAERLAPNSSNTRWSRRAISCRCADRLTERSNSQHTSVGRCPSEATISAVSRSTAPAAPVVTALAAPRTTTVASIASAVGRASGGSTERLETGSSGNTSTVGMEISASTGASDWAISAVRCEPCAPGGCGSSVAIIASSVGGSSSVTAGTSSRGVRPAGGDTAPLPTSANPTSTPQCTTRLTTSAGTSRQIAFASVSG